MVHSRKCWTVQDQAEAGGFARVFSVGNVTKGTWEAGCGLALFFSSPHKQIGADEGLKIAVDDTVDVADFHLRTVIFDQAIGLQDLGTDLRPEVYIEF